MAGCGAVVIGAIAWVRLSAVAAPDGAEWLAGELRSVTIDRLTATITIGACLGVAGVLLRTATKNPLADPEITGVNSGAAFGAVLATTLTGAAGGAALLPGAFAGAVTAASATIFFGMRGRSSTSAAMAVQRMVLLGMAVSALFSALTAIVLVLDEAQLATVLSWLSGRLGGVRMADVVPALIVAAAVVPAVVVGGRGFDALVAGDSIASAVGARPRLIRLLAVSAAVLLIAPSVAAAGPIGFLGLMAAVAAHRVCGPRHRIAVPVAAVLGAAVLLIADSIGQWLWAPAETPVGIVTSLIGVPVLLWGIGALRAGGSRIDEKGRS
ncbi:FecCD family ABC transporter permease [Corynebacterium sp. NPDC060344]|uniref:FecCD family ABC transporter permease n=1 Tax=Corynebacterium sp. NPDC060344 TaxID=3347101 RepID=UPI0036490F20